MVMNLALTLIATLSLKKNIILQFSQESHGKTLLEIEEDNKICIHELPVVHILLQPSQC